MALYYRKDVLAKAGMPPPTAWEQLMSQATTLVRDGLVKYGFVWQGTQYEGLTCNFMEYLASAGGTATTSDCTRATLNSAAATKAVEFMRALITSGATPPAVTTFEEPQAMNVFAGGNAAFLRNWGYAYSASITPAAGGKLTQDQVGVAPLPAFGGQQAPGYSCIGGSNMYISTRTARTSAPA
jgi:multiple sugar transport system substrate-binding protein